MGYAEDLEAVNEEYEHLKKVRDEKEREYSLACQDFKDAEKRRGILRNLDSGKRPYLVGEGYWRGTDMMGKGGTRYTREKTVWFNDLPKQPGDRPYDFALELEDDLETIKSVGYLTGRAEVTLARRKAACDLPENDEWDNETKRVFAEWKEKIEEARRILGV